MMLLESLGRHIVNCHVKQVKHRCPICMKIGSWRQDAARRHAVSCFVKRVDGGGDVGGSVLEEASSVSGERHQNSPYAAIWRQNERIDEENWTPEEPRIEVKREIDDDYDEPESEDEVDELEDDMDEFENHTD
ncbi:hypothetical protein A0H81_01846 [Grifola frondosa]|uniref:Uncharacterized protein n=1 Tax=Grifola frondosa TaxID=5627 RepID=A0A1C7MMF9_GRIFR|nr:hypothetical protein A0H81_01846 [Grifola frondosa]